MKNALLPLLLCSTLGLPAAEAPRSRAAMPAASPRSAAVPDAVYELLDLSLKNGKGLMFHLGSQSVGGAVTKIGEQTVEIRNREYSRIVIRLDRIDAVSMN